MKDLTKAEFLGLMELLENLIVANNLADETDLKDVYDLNSDFTCDLFAVLHSETIINYGLIEGYKAFIRNKGIFFAPRGVVVYRPNEKQGIKNATIRLKLLREFKRLYIKNNY